MIVFQLLHLCVLHAQTSEKDILFLKEVVEFLCHDSLQGRQAGSEGEMIAAQFIEDKMSDLKLKFFFQNGYSESFIFIDDAGLVQISRNVAGLINHHADSTIIIVANYDHLGFGGVRSLSYTNTEIHRGADDNASGVALLLLLADKLQQKAFNNYNYLFLAAGAEEPGYYGTGGFVRKYGKQLSNVCMIVNLHMVGRVNSENPQLYISRSIELFTLLVEDSFEIIIIKPEKEMLTPFETAGFVELKISSGQHADDHTVRDTPDKLNYRGMIQISDRILFMLQKQ